MRIGELIAIDIRRWCEVCGRFTRSRMSDWGANELCAEHDELDNRDDWD